MLAGVTVDPNDTGAVDTSGVTLDPTDAGVFAAVEFWPPNLTIVTPLGVLLTSPWVDFGLLLEWRIPNNTYTVIIIIGIDALICIGRNHTLT